MKSLQNMSIGSPAPSMQPKILFCQGSFKDVLNAMKIKQDSTKANPIVVQVDPEYPERSVPFFIQRTPEMMCPDKNFHVVWNIRLKCDDGDINSWEAYIPNQAYAPLVGRCVAIKGVSVSDDLLTYDEAINTAADPAFDDYLMAACSSTFNAMKNDETRKACYYLIVFPENVTLDNNIFSHGENGQVNKQIVGTMIPEDASNIGKDKLFPMLFWNIAEHSGKPGVGKAKQVSIMSIYQRAPPPQAG